MKVEHIDYKDNLKKGTDKLNQAIDQSNEALSTANTAKTTADSALSKSETTQTQLDTIVINGDSSVEAAQARVDANGEAKTTLKKRLDDDYNEVTSKLAEKSNEIDKNVFLRFLNLARKTTPEAAPLYIIGDSISEGATTLDYSNDGYANILVQAFAKAFGFSKAHRGFVGFKDVTVYAGTTNFHSIVYNGFSGGYPHYFNDIYFGGVLTSSSVLGDKLTVTYTGKDCRLAFVRRNDGGLLKITVDGVVKPNVDTSLNTGYTFDKFNLSAPFVSAGTEKLADSTHTIIIEKLDNKPTDLCGMIYADNCYVLSPIAYNVGRSSIALANIPNDVLDIYTHSGMAILALGVNDQLLATDINVFTQKVNYICNAIATQKGSLLICDFMFSLPSTNAYKQVLKNAALQYGFQLLDFASLFFGDTTINKNNGLLNTTDGVHPTIQGHELIANVIMKVIGLPYNKQSLSDMIALSNLVITNTPVFDSIPLWNGWANSGYGNENARVAIIDNKVILGGIISSGTTVRGTVIGTLPNSKYYPPHDIYAISGTDNGVGVTIIKTNGDIQCDSGIGTGWRSLQGIEYYLYS